MWDGEGGWWEGRGVVCCLIFCVMWSRLGLKGVLLGLGDGFDGGRCVVWGGVALRMGGIVNGRTWPMKFEIDLKRVVVGNLEYWSCFGSDIS